MGFDIKAGAGTIHVPADLVVVAAERLWRLPQAQRDQRLEKAKQRLAGKHPTARDAAIVALADH